ncbi:MAG: tRNA pseudouridine(38-40) synthase TruA [Alphaproteobacteria bacterium]
MRLRATIAYDGTDFLGWQSQSGKGETIQEALERALSTVLRQEIRVAAAGRTDAGVHATGQVIAFDVEGDPFPAGAVADPAGRAPLDGLQRSANAVLPASIVLRDLRATRADFSPRHDAVRRAYRYRIWNSAVRSPFEARTSWQVREPLDDRAMACAASAVVGEHDFTSFQGADNVPRSSVRRVESCVVEREEDRVEVRITANAFVRHMVRNLVGELVEIGLGRREPGDLARLLEARDRRLAPAPAPPLGLFLERVDYEEGR